MVEVVLTASADRRILTLKVTGHAGYASAGHDIVCASASILAYTFAQIVTAMEAHGDLSRAAIIKLESGCCVISCHPKDNALYAEALHSLFTIQVGYSLLAHNFPENVRLTQFGSGGICRREDTPKESPTTRAERAYHG